MYQVLVCSNYDELSVERQQICVELANMDCIATGFPFSAQSNVELYKANLKMLEQADYVIFIIGSQYGCLSPSGVGYVHQIFAQANARGLPIASLIYEGEHRSSGDSVDFTRLQGFKGQLHQSYWRAWRSSAELVQFSCQIVESLIEEYPSVGWSRGAPTDSSSEVVRLQRELQALEHELSLSHAGEGHSSEIRVQELNFSCQMFSQGNTHKIDDRVILDTQRLFLLFAPALTSAPTEARLYRAFCDKILEAVRPALQKKYPQGHAFLNLKARVDNFDELKVRYLADGLAREDDGRWKLTAAGNRKMMRLMAKKHLKEE